MDTPLPTLTFQPRKPFRRRVRTTPAPLILTSAALTVDPESGEGSLRLTFDRAIDVANLVPAQVTVDDGDGPGWAYAGGAVTAPPAPPDPRTLVLALVKTGTAVGPTVLHATAATGIVAAAAADEPGGGGTWAGVASVALPLG